MCIINDGERIFDLQDETSNRITAPPSDQSVWKMLSCIWCCHRRCWSSVYRLWVVCLSVGAAPICLHQNVFPVKAIDKLNTEAQNPCIWWKCIKNTHLDDTSVPNVRDLLVFLWWSSEIISLLIHTFTTLGISSASCTFYIWQLPLFNN